MPTDDSVKGTNCYKFISILYIMIRVECQVKARMYMSNKRSLSLADGHQAFHTFNPDECDCRDSFLGMNAVNDEMLMPLSSRKHIAKEDIQVLLLPVVGSITFRVEKHETRFLEADTCQLLNISKGCALEITNPFREGLVNYIAVWFSADDETDYYEQHSQFDLQRKKNTLTEIFASSSAKGFLGEFSGRADHRFTLRETSRGVFAFVIQGSFEVEKRLLQNRDGLALWNTKSIEFEALSKDAIIFLVEL